MAKSLLTARFSWRGKFRVQFVNLRLLILTLLPCCLVSSCVSPRQPEPKPQVHLHAHNDYEHKRPLLDALDHGFCSIEADIFLVNGQLLVAHEKGKVSPDRTLERLYLDPLRDRFIRNRGRIYRGGPEVTLLIDIKTDWQTTYPVLRETLSRYTNMLSLVRGKIKRESAVLAIITGDRSKDMFAGETLRLATFDGELEDLNSGLPATLIPWISSNWAKTFTWRGVGDFPAEQKSKLQEIVEQAHSQGRRVRFWGAPDKPAFWRELLNNGVDLINTDDLEGAQQFMLQQTGAAPRGG